MRCTACAAPLSRGLLLCPSCGQRVASSGQRGGPTVILADPGPSVHERRRTTGTPNESEKQKALAGLERRALAFMVDLLVLCPLAVIGRHMGPGASIGAAFLYFSLCEASSWQGTIGKRVLGLQVTDLSGEQLRFGRTSMRFFGKLLAIAPAGLGLLVASRTMHRQTLHDLIASTLVVERGTSSRSD